MWKVIFLAVLIHFACAKKPTIDDYCKVSSGHTVCQTKCARSSACGETKDKFAVLSDAEREMVLDKHNAIRNEVAEGKWVHVKLEKAADMQVLSWDKELEWIAGCWIKQCIFQHDKIRYAVDGTHCGQNLAIHSMKFPDPNYKMDEAFWQDGFHGMFEEYKLFKPETIAHLYDKFQYQPGTGHLTQLIWGNTKYVGCAKIHYICENGWQCFQWGCNYKLPGSVAEEKMYTVGDPACADKNDKYPSLCGKIRPMSEDKYEPPFRLDDAQIPKPNLLLILIVLYVLSIFLL